MGQKKDLAKQIFLTIFETFTQLEYYIFVFVIRAKIDLKKKKASLYNLIGDNKQKKQVIRKPMF